MWRQLASLSNQKAPPALASHRALHRNLRNPQASLTQAMRAIAPKKRGPGHSAEKRRNKKEEEKNRAPRGSMRTTTRSTLVNAMSNSSSKPATGMALGAGPWPCKSRIKSSALRGKMHRTQGPPKKKKKKHRNKCKPPSPQPLPRS